MRKIIILLLFLASNFISLSNSIDSSKVVIESLLKQKANVKRDSIITANFRIILDLVPIVNLAELEKWITNFNKFSQKSMFLDSKNQALLESGRYHYRKGQNKLSFEEINQAFEAFKKNGNIKDQYVSINRLSVLISQDLIIDQDLDTLTRKKLLKYLNENLEIIKESKNATLIANQEVTLGMYHLLMKNYKLAKKYYSNSFKTVSNYKESNFYGYYNSIFAVGLCELYLNRQKEGFSKINFVKNICKTKRKDDREKFLLITISYNLANYYSAKRQYQNALKELDYGVAFQSQTKYPTSEVLFQKAYYEVNKNLGNNKLALFHLEKLQAINKKREKTNFNQLYTEWQTKYETEKQSAAIKTLEIKQLKSESEKNNLIRNVLLMSLLVGICLVFYVYKNNLNLQTKNTELEAKNKEIKGALLKGQTIERKRVAEELHDNLSAKIAAVRWRMESLEPTFDNERDTDFYHKTSLALGEIYTDVRLIAHNLLPAALEQKGLIVAIKNLISEINGLNKTQFTANLPEQEPRFANKIEYELYSILLELSNNILKHSKAEHANVTLKSTHNLLQLIVADDGIGMNNAGQTSGMGFGNLKSRVESINGILKISSENGLEIMINVPV